MQGAIVKSFTYNNLGGNRAGVIILDKQIETQEKQSIAAKIGLSETAFIKQIDETNYDISFFTPVCEVDLCGHATIAAFYYLGVIGMIKGDTEVKTVYQNTKVGKLEIKIEFKNHIVDYVMMQQATPQIFKELKGESKKNIAKSLNIDEDNIGLMDFQIEPTIVSTGLKDIIIPVKTRAILNDIKANNSMITNISLKNDVVGYHVYTIDKTQIYTRNFAPLVGINEECATGTSNGALGSLLFKKRILKGDIQIIQGESMNEPSLIFVNVSQQNDRLDVRVGGKALVIENIIS